MDGPSRRMPETLRATDPLAGDWILLVILFVLGMLGWVNLVSPKKWRLITRSFFSFRLGRQSLRDELDVQDRTLIGLAVMASGTIALFAYQCLVLRGIARPEAMLWVEMFLGSLALLAVQALVLRAAGLLFAADGGLSEYLYIVLLLHVALGIMLLPVAGVLAWPHRAEWRLGAIFIGAGLVASITIYRWFRAAVLGLGEGVPLRYVFIYLCALEILPVALACQQALRIIHDPSHSL